MTASPASAFATALLDAFVARGIRDVVVCPGSRSQALALAAAAADAAGMLRLRVRIDERSAGFTALGLAVETGAPVLVIVTSGTAVAELHPAVLEAAHAGLPLVVLSADRPAELVGVGANQATIQPGMFGSAARVVDVPAPDAGTDAVAQAAATVARVLDDLRGPAQLNLAFREPLSGEAPAPASAPAGIWMPPPAGSDEVALVPGPRTVVVAGAGAGQPAEALARALAAPLLAEVASGARFGPNLVPAYRELLAEPGFGDEIERVVLFGRPTLSREIPALVGRLGAETVVVRSPGRDDWNPTRTVARFADAVVAASDTRDPVEARAADRAWVGRWVHASRALLAADEPVAASLGDDYVERARFARDQLAQARAPITRRMLVEAVWAASWPHDRLVLGASRLIRDLDRVAPGKRIPVHANRGLAGIDGTIATATGIALAAQAAADPRAGVTRVLLGDLTLLHDAGSLLVDPGDPKLRMQVIVGDDGGGTIFDTLEVRGSADPALFDRVQYTPQRIDLAALAAAYGWGYRRLEQRADLDALTGSAAPRTILHVPLER